MAILPIGIGSEEASYRIERSLRFNSADSAYLSKAFTTPSNQTVWTWSNWVKRSQLGANQSLFSAFNGSGTSAALTFNSSDQFQIESGGFFVANSTAVFRDPSAFYHVVARVNGSTTTVWINNVSILTYTGGTLTAFNTSGVTHSIGRRQGGSDYYHNGYMTEVNFIDGQALAPTSFGEYNSVTGVWQPKAYTGSYGTNGFYLDFSDNSGTTSTTLGKDYSGNGNNWTPNNFSVTAGAGNDSLVDTPTPYGTDTGVGGEVRGNYCTVNPLNNLASGNITITNGNLDLQLGTPGQWRTASSTMSMPYGKWYWEIRLNNTPNSDDVWYGILADDISFAGNRGLSDSQIGSYGYSYSNNGYKRNNGSASAYGATWTNGDIIGIAFDATNNQLTFYKNGVSQGLAFTVSSGKTYVPAFSGASSQPSFSVNFGQRPFAYTAPSGFKALCTQNLPEPTVKDGGDYFNAVLYTGNSSTQSISGVGFQPDMVWVKDRSAAQWHNITDVVRGVGKEIFTNATNAEETNGGISSLNADGFSLINWDGANKASDAYVAWNWKAGGSGVTNTAGTITSTVSANTTAGFSIATMTGNGSVFTFGHGLGVAPAMVIVKYRSGTAPNIAGWAVYHKSLTSAAYRIDLNATSGQISDINAWNSTAPTSTVVTVGTNLSVNNTPLVAYCFAPIAGYSAFGSYVGNGSSDGPMIFTNMRPRWVLIKRSSAIEDWAIFDTGRNPSNLTNLLLSPNLSSAETTVTGNPIDILSNGFKIRGTGNTVNGSGSTYIYAAFAENPFRYSLAR